MPSAFLADEIFEDPFSLEEIKADPKKHILWAAENNEIETVETLLRSDSQLVCSTDEDMYTPLHRASYNGHVEVLKILLTNGADINARTLDGWQPFHCACRWDNLEAAKLLLSLGADKHSVTNGNNTALHLAASNGEAESVIKYLLAESDIDVTIKNTAGDTAEDVACRNSRLARHFKTLRVAKQTGAQADEAGNTAGAAKQTGYRYTPDDLCLTEKSNWSFSKLKKILLTRDTFYVPLYISISPASLLKKSLYKTEDASVFLRFS